MVALSGHFKLRIDFYYTCTLLMNWACYNQPMNKSKTNEGGEDRNNNEEVLVVVVSSMKVAQNLSEEEEEEEERTSSYCGRMQHFSFSCN